jgi:hypothetical protein
MRQRHHAKREDWDLPASSTRSAHRHKPSPPRPRRYARSPGGGLPCMHAGGLHGGPPCEGGGHLRANLMAGVAQLHVKGGANSGARRSAVVVVPLRCFERLQAVPSRGPERSITCF